MGASGSSRNSSLKVAMAQSRISGSPRGTDSTAVAFPPYPVHDLAAIDADDAIDMDAKGRRLGDGVGGSGGGGGGDQELARHAAHPRAGGAILAAFDENSTRACTLGGAVRGKTRRAGTDYRHLDPQGFHASPVPSG
jgi:hypothetical protein